MRGEGCVQLLKYGSWATSAGFADFYVVQTISPNFGGDFSNLSCFLLFKVWAETHVLLTLSLPRVINLRIQPSPIGRLRFETPERGFSGVSISIPVFCPCLVSMEFVTELPFFLQEEVRASTEDWVSLGMHGNQSGPLVCEGIFTEDRYVGPFGNWT